MRLQFLGTGGSWPTKRRGSMAIVLTSGPDSLLLDCGEGTQRQLLFSSVSPMKIRGVLITHLHGDHFLGLPGLVQTMALNDRSEELHVWGPTGIARAWRCAGEMSPFSGRFDVIIHELEGDASFDFRKWHISCTSVDHSTNTIAYRVDEWDRPGRFHRERALKLGIPEGRLWGKLQRGEDISFHREGIEITVKPEQVLGETRKGLSVVYSGDTRPCSTLSRLAKGTDVLIHEATFSSRLSELAGEVGHSTIGDAAGIAREAGAGKLVLVHISPRYSKEESMNDYISEAMKAFPDIMVPEDLEVLEVTRQNDDS